MSVQRVAGACDSGASKLLSIGSGLCSRDPGSPARCHRYRELSDAAALLGQEGPVLAHCHAARRHGHDLVVEAAEAAFMLADEQRLEAALAAAWHLDTHRPATCQRRLGTGAVAVSAAVLGLVGAWSIAQVAGQFGAQGRSISAFLNASEMFSRDSALIGPVTNWSMMSLEMGGTAATAASAAFATFFARHTCSLCSCCASHTKLRTGSSWLLLPAAHASAAAL